MRHIFNFNWLCMAWSLKNFACMVSIFIFLEFIFYNIHNICKSKHLNMEIFLYIFWNFYILSLGCYKLKKNTLMKIPGKRADLCQCVCVCMCTHLCVVSTCVFILVCGSHILWLNYSKFVPSLRWRLAFQLLAVHSSSVWFAFSCIWK